MTDGLFEINQFRRRKIFDLFIANGHDESFIVSLFGYLEQPLPIC